MKTCHIAARVTLCGWFMLVVSVSRGIPADKWVEVRSPNLTVISNSSEKAARDIAAQFEQFHYVFQQTFAGSRIDTGVPLIVFYGTNIRSGTTFGGWSSELWPAHRQSEPHI
jgi:hypothetical protein